jgi:hypothetical protein
MKASWDGYHTLFNILGAMQDQQSALLMEGANMASLWNFQFGITEDNSDQLQSTAQRFELITKLAPENLLMVLMTAEAFRWCFETSFHTDGMECQ